MGDPFILELPDLKIGDLLAKIPIIQGGMAVRISTAPLAAAVADEGGIGIIAGSGLRVDELRSQIRRARKLSDGIVGVNIMIAVSNFKKLLHASVEEGIDLVIAGAGFSRDMFEICRKKGVEIVPIVCSAKLARISEKLGASAVVVEGKEAGGHLGTDQPMKKLLAEIKDEVRMPVIAAGGIVNGKDIAEVLDFGADGVQMGSRFVASEECAADDEFKKLYLESGPGSDVLIDSPVGLTGRVLKNEFLSRWQQGSINTGEMCSYLCLKRCSRSFCIMEALVQAQQGNMREGLVFAGERAHLIDSVLSVKEIVSDLTEEARRFLSSEQISEAPLQS